MRRVRKPGTDFDYGYTLREFIDVKELLGPIPLVHGEFKHGEIVKNKWRAWVCRKCGIVRLEVAEGPEDYTCEICTLRGDIKARRGIKR